MGQLPTSLHGLCAAGANETAAVDVVLVGSYPTRRRSGTSMAHHKGKCSDNPPKRAWTFETGYHRQDFKRFLLGYFRWQRLLSVESQGFALLLGLTRM
jgi:hypothetical protein